VYLLGGAEGVAERAGRKLAEIFPALRVAGADCPPWGFEQDPVLLEETIARVSVAAPDLVFVALGFPKQEQLMHLLRERVPGAWSLGCGGSLTMVSGEVPRAPSWMQRAGLEWVHRLAMEPRRMMKRYLVHGLPFAVRLLVGAAVRRPRSPLGAGHS
jgi:N-acetylglucosaminyldiphosphoundecaprenol N-acetyl-beta-D-mannosaminyltransferase